MVGEKVICTFNQHSHGFMNGEQGIVEEYSECEDEHGETEMRVRLLSLTDGRSRTVEFNPASFDTDPEVAQDARKSIGGFDYGYCVTIHKAQGSEWENVLVYEESIRREYAKMMYTAFTRAQKRLTVYRT